MSIVVLFRMETRLQLVYYLLCKWDKRLYSFVSAVKICELHEVFTELSGHFKVKNGKISAQFHTTLCIQFLDRENNDKDSTLPLRKQICLRKFYLKNIRIKEFGRKETNLVLI